MAEQKTAGLVSATGSMVSMDRADVNTTGLDMATFVVEESGVYRTADGTQARQFNAGHRMSIAEAAQFQMIDTAVIVGQPIDTSLSNPVEGEKIAMLLRAAGYEVTPASATVTDTDPPRPVSTSDPATGDALNVSDQVATAATADTSDQPKWYQSIVEKNPDAAPMQDGETEAAYRERVKSSEPARSNENAPNESR